MHVVCAWLGNSPKVAQRSYLLVTSEDFQKAILVPQKSGTKSGTVNCKSGTVSGRKNSQAVAEDQGKHRENVISACKEGDFTTDGEGVTKKSRKPLFLLGLRRFWKTKLPSNLP